MENKVTACMIVKNEDRFVWYAINSVLPYVGRLIVFDTGSTDNTVPVIKSIKNRKIVFSQKEKLTPALLSVYRQEQAGMVKKGWYWIVDGDEVYPKVTAEIVVGQMKKGTDGIIVRRFDLLGDVYHYQIESVGSYNQFGVKGHNVLRCINLDNFKNLKVKGLYPDEYFSENGINIKQRGKDRFAFVSDRIFHAMYLKRSSIGSNLPGVINRNKFKIEEGLPVRKEMLPEVFFAQRPEVVPDVLEKRGVFYEIAAKILTPVKKLKRKIL